MAFRNTYELAQMIKKADIDSQLTPKSVSGGDSIFLPKILKDYPQFNIDLAKSVVENCIRDIFNSFFDGNTTEFRKKYNSKILAQCEMFIRKYGNISVTGLKIHRTTIYRYEKLYGTSTIKFQTAFQYEIDGKNSGNRTMQEKFETEYTFKISNNDASDRRTNISLRCNYCGAPVFSIGTKTCQYCDSDLILDLESYWEITDINVH